jgi:hypothetical protein
MRVRHERATPKTRPKIEIVPSSMPNTIEPTLWPNESATCRRSERRAERWLAAWAGVETAARSFWPSLCSRRREEAGRSIPVTQGRPADITRRRITQDDEKVEDSPGGGAVEPVASKSR